MNRIPCLLVVLWATVIGCNRPSPPSPTAAPEPEVSAIDQARAALARRDFDTAETAVTQHLVQQPGDAAALELAGDIASAQSKAQQAIDLFRDAIEQSDSPAAQLYEKLGRQWMNVGAPYEAVDVLRESVTAHGDNPKVRADLAGLLASLGMVRDAAGHLRWLLRRGVGGLNELIMLADLTIPQTDRAICEYSLKNRPDDLRPQYPLSLETAFQGDHQTAADELQKVTAKHPDFAVGWAHYGRALVEIADGQRLRSWRQSVPDGTQSWATFWIAAGLWEEKQGRPEAAARAFWNAVQIDDSNGEALSHLAANLAQIGRQDDAKTVAQRAADVSAMRDNVESLFSWRKNSQKAALAIAQSMERLGRVWEAEAWARASLVMTQELVDDARQQHQRYRSQLTSTTPWMLPDASLASRVDLASLPAFRWTDDASPQSQPSQVDAPTSFRFADEAKSRNLIHTCAIDKSQPEASIWIYQSTAGGVGVIDFDLDGWPDLYLTSIDGKPLEHDSSPNRMFRNAAGKFVDATAAASVGDRGFAQGVAVGDYNADGFPDLLVGNIGENRLYRNNGDGTFADVTSQLGLSGSRWTTSVSIADIDTDGVADIFEVNYCAGESPFRQACIDSDVNEARSCSPLVFQAEPDRLWRGVGDHSFEDVSQQWLPDQVPGHGLGLVVGQIDPEPGVDVYVANDMTANQYWSSTLADGRFELREQAAIRGLAVNSRSRSQASMGMAIGDPDLDGDLDIFLTHFTDDHNTIYEQLQPGTWFDRTDSVGLAAPSTKMLAFGTEWIDADNDGAVELMVANGNVDDFSHQGHALRMTPQFFVRAGDGTWSVDSSPSLGAYFRREVVGRAVATADLNRDLRQDLIVTHLYDPVSALINHTETESRSVQIRLIGTQSHRDAIGSVITGQVGGKSRQWQLTAGDGFQCSNERVIAIGLGTSASVENVVVRWPDGDEDSLGALAAGQSYLIVEGDSDAFALE